MLSPPVWYKELGLCHLHLLRSIVSISAKTLQDVCLYFSKNPTFLHLKFLVLGDFFNVCLPLSLVKFSPLLNLL